MSIDVEHLSFSYGSHHVLRDLSFRIPDNTLVNVLGPNGVGKSTLFRCILCLNNGWTGGIRVNGKDLRSISIRERASEVAYIPQSHSSTYAYDVLDVVLMSAGGGIGLFSTPKRMHVDRAWDALERVGIAHLGHRPYTQISGESASWSSSRAPSLRAPAPSSWTSLRARSITATPCAYCPPCASSRAKA